MKRIIPYFLIYIFCCSCSKEQQNTVYPQIIIENYELTNEKNLSFSLFHSDISQDLSSEISRIGFTCQVENETKTILHNKELENCIREFCIQYGILAEKITVGYLHNRFKAIQITSDKTYSGIPAGNSLNQFFQIIGEFAYLQNGSYHLTTRKNDILNMSNVPMESLIFPNDFTITISRAPTVSGQYSFYIRLIDEHDITYKAPIGTIDLVAE